MYSTGCEEPDKAAALGNIIARMTAPNSELSTLQWRIKKQCELIGLNRSSYYIS